MERQTQEPATVGRLSWRTIVNAANQRARVADHPRVPAPAASMLSMDLLVAGFAIMGAVLMSLLR